MSQYHINQIKFNNGIHPVGRFPLDDREVWSSVEDLFITKSQTENPSTMIDNPGATLYNKVYKGMTVKMVVSDAEMAEYGLTANVVALTCIDDTPYIPDSIAEVNKDNFRSYWREDMGNVVAEVAKIDARLNVTDASIADIDSSITDIKAAATAANAVVTAAIANINEVITGTINPSIDDLVDYTQNVNISNAGGIIVGNSAGAFDCKGKQYTVKVNVDDDTIKIVTDKVTGCKYRLENITPNAGMFKSYQLACKAPGAKEYTRIEDCTIDIPKDFLLDDVHYCKAVPQDGKLVETAVQGDAKWDEADGEVYIHYIWNTKDAATGKTSESWLKVSDFIKVDIDAVNSSISKLQTSLAKLDASVNSRIDDVIATHTADITDINSSITEIKELILDNELVNSTAATDLDARLKDILDRITALEADVAELKNKK